MKVIAWSLAGLVTVGGAVTAGTVAFSSSGSTSTGANPGDSSPSTVGSTAGSTAGSAVTTMPASGSKGTSGNLSLTAVQQCTDLTTKVESVIGDTGAALNKAGLSSVLASPVVSQVLETAPVSGLLKTVGNATAVPDYCGLVLALPTVPVPSAFTQIPPFILNQALSALPVTDLAGALNSLPTGVLSQTLGDLSSAQLSSVFTMLPPGVAGELLRTLPANSLSSVLTALPVSTVTGLLPNLPTADLTQVLTTLPNAATGTVLSELPTAEQASTQLAAVPAAGGTHLLVHARTAADPWQLLKDAGVVGLPGTVFNTQAPSVRLCSAQPSAVIDAAADRIRAL